MNISFVSWCLSGKYFLVARFSFNEDGILVTLRTACAPLLGFIRVGEYILTLDYMKYYIKRSYHEVQDWITKKF